MDKIKEIEIRLSSTSKGDWEYNSINGILTLGYMQDMELGKVRCKVPTPFVQFSMAQINDDFVFITNAKSDIEYLINEINRLRKLSTS